MMRDGSNGKKIERIEIFEVIIVWFFRDMHTFSILQLLTNMIGTGRRINDFDTFMNHNQMPSPRQQVPLANIHNYHSNQERHHSPNRISNTRKPMISPARSPRPQTHKVRKPETDRREQFCSNENHPHKKAEYYIHIEDQDMYYCGVCATQAASQGFTVNRIPSGNSATAGLFNKTSRIVPHYPQYMGNKRYYELTELLKGIITLENEYKKLQPRRVTDHYEKQSEMLNCFYDELVGIVQKMRADHLNDLQAECQKNIQAQAFGLDNLRMHVEELGQVWQDIEANIQEVVENVDQVNYENCMNTHRNSLQIFSHKLQEFREEQESFTRYHQPSLVRKVKTFQQQLIELWNEENQQKTVKVIPDNRRHNQHSERSGTTIKNVHEMLPKQVAPPNGEGQGAFRNLFPDEESQERLPQASPQFKAF